MKLKMQARYLWDAVEDEDVDIHDDRSTLEAICSGVPQEMVPTLATKPSAKQAWEAIRSMRIGDDRVRKSTAQSLRAEYEQIAFRDGESVEDFALRLTNIVQRLALLGDPEPQPKVVAKYLHVARPRYRQLVVSIETLLDVDTLSIEEVTGRLKAATDDETSLAQNVSGKLLLMKEQWLERYKKKEKESGRGGSSSGSRSKGRGRGRGRGSGGEGDSRAAGGERRPNEPCGNCGKKGHLAKDCRGKKKVDQAHVAQDDEPTLLLAVGCEQEDGIHPQIEQLPPPQESKPATPRANSPPIHANGQLHFIENKVFAAFDESGDRDPKRWVLDTSTSNHMSGA
ncbi:uncharacterized protein [Miscanthus floridulus]|uniref:uncharacterized protein n=1 Tax=Miscanthus floridulus TaxID=154761 RepID=UPI00345ADFA5